MRTRKNVVNFKATADVKAGKRKVRRRSHPETGPKQPRNRSRAAQKEGRSRPEIGQLLIATIHLFKYRALIVNFFFQSEAGSSFYVPDSEDDSSDEFPASKSRYNTIRLDNLARETIRYR